MSVAKIIITPRRKVKQNSPAKRGQVNNPFLPPKRGQVNNPFCSPFEKGGKGDFMLSLDFRKSPLTHPYQRGENQKGTGQ